MEWRPRDGDKQAPIAVSLRPLVGNETSNKIYVGCIQILVCNIIEDIVLSIDKWRTLFCLLQSVYYVSMQMVEFDGGVLFKCGYNLHLFFFFLVLIKIELWFSGDIHFLSL